MSIHTVFSFRPPTGEERVDEDVVNCVPRPPGGGDKRTGGHCLLQLMGMTSSCMEPYAGVRPLRSTIIPHGAHV